MTSTEFCGGVHTAQSQRPMQISIGFVHILMVSVSVSLLDSVNEPIKRKIAFISPML